jgi:hypothetical protein
MVITPDQLAHILPTMSEHINRLGRYEFDPTADSIQTSLSALPLKSAIEMAEQLGLNNMKNYSR